MARRHKTKRNERASRILALEAALADGATRIQKIEALQAFGVKISRKADSKRVNGKMLDAAADAGEELSEMDKRHKAANRRKRGKRGR